MSTRVADLRSVRPQRVCLIKPSALGDIVNAQPVLWSLRAIWPEASLAWVVNRSLRGLVDDHPEIDEVIAYDRARSGPSPAGIARFLRFSTGKRRTSSKR
ncbi:glycosyltransferase family 9 protein [Singulisphaera rosea]